MKYLFLLFFVFLVSVGYAQYPTIQNLGAPKTLVVSKGGFQADSSLILPTFADTTTANQSPYIKFYSGNMIRVDNKVWMRNKTATAWISIGSSDGYQFMQQVDSSTVLFCRTIGNCDTLQAIPGDSVIIVGGGGGINSLTAIGNSPNANGATIVNDTTLRLEPASATFGGVVTTNSQTFEGSKTFLRDIKVNSIDIGLGGNNRQGNTRVGESALPINSTGDFNTAIGFRTLKINVQGSDNTAIGYNVLQRNASGNNNTGLGSFSLYNVTSGNDNTSIGMGSQYFTTIGVQNTSLGGMALRKNNIGNNNISIGYNSMFENTSGYSNVGIGSSALYSNKTKSNLVAIGDSSLYNNLSGAQNTAIGSKSLYTNISGSNNTATGFGALYFCDTCDDNTANGLASLFSNTGGDGNTASGFSSLYSNTNGKFNSAFGYATLFYNDTAKYNSAFGNAALYYHKTGDYNVAIGDRSLFFDSTGVHNVGIGYASNYLNKQGRKNVAIGSFSLLQNTDSANVAVGYSSLSNLTSAFFLQSRNNTALGTFSGTDLVFGSNNICIGYNSQPSANFTSDEVTIGNSSNNSYRIYAASWTNASDSSYKHDISPITMGLDFIKSLKPVEFIYNNSKANKKSLGFVAQEVKSNMSNPNDYTLVPKMDSTHLGLNTTEIIPILTKAIQQQDEQVQSLKDTLINVEEGGSFTLPDATLFTGTVYLIFKPVYPSSLTSVKGDVYNKSLNQIFSVSRGTYTFKSDGKNWYQF